MDEKKLLYNIRRNIIIRCKVSDEFKITLLINNNLIGEFNRKEGKMNGFMEAWLDSWKDGWIYEKMDGFIGGWMDS